MKSIIFLFLATIFVMNDGHSQETINANKPVVERLKNLPVQSRKDINKLGSCRGGNIGGCEDGGTGPSPRCRQGETCASKVGDVEQKKLMIEKRKLYSKSVTCSLASPTGCDPHTSNIKVKKSKEIDAEALNRLKLKKEIGTPTSTPGAVK